MRMRRGGWSLAIGCGVIIAMATAIAPARAQYESQSVALAGGPATPRQTLRDTLGSGWNAVASINFHFAARRLTVRFDGMYAQFPRRSGSTQKAQLVGFTANGEIDPLGDVGPYAVAGWGMYQVLRSGTTGPTTYEPGVNGGAGFRIPIMRFTIFGEVRVHHVLGAGKPEFMPLSFGLRI